jgi:hypothetical protein
MQRQTKRKRKKKKKVTPCTLPPKNQRPSKLDDQTKNVLYPSQEEYKKLRHQNWRHYDKVQRVMDRVAISRWDEAIPDSAEKILGHAVSSNWGGLLKQAGAQVWHRKSANSENARSVAR